MDEFPARVSRIISFLENKEFWERRIEGLTQLHRLFGEDISTLGYEPAVALLNTLKLPLKAQVEDPRSQITRDACACVTELAKSTLTDRSVWEYASDWFLQPLLQASCNTVSVIAQAALDTLRSIATVGRVNRHALLAFIAACSHKHNVIRRNAFECVLMLLHTVDIATLQKSLLSIQKVIRTGMSDALQEARRLARMCFWGLEKIHEDSAVVLYEGLSPTNQKAIDAEKSGYEAWAANFGTVARQVLSFTVGMEPNRAAQQQQQLSALAATPSHRGGGGGGGGGAQTVVMSPLLTTPQQERDRRRASMEEDVKVYQHYSSKSPAAMSFLTGMPMPATIAMANKEGGEPSPNGGGATMSGGGGSENTFSSLLKGTADGKGQHSPVKGGGPAINSGAIVGQGSRQRKERTPVASSARSLSNGKAARNLIGTLGGGGGNTSTTATNGGGAATRTRSAASRKGTSAASASVNANDSTKSPRAGGGDGGGSRRSASSAAPRGGGGGLVSAASAHAALGISSSISAAATASAAPPTKAAAAVSPYDTWEAIKAQSRSNDWSSRSMAYVELSQLLDLNMLPPEFLSAAVAIATRHLNDTHYRVAVSATGALARLLPKASREYFDSIELILALHITNLMATKEPLRAAATVQLGAILNGFGPTNILPPLWRVIQTCGAIVGASDTAGHSGSGSGGATASSSSSSSTAASSARLRLGAVEFLLHVVQSHRSTFANASIMRSTLQKLLALYRKVLPAVSAAFSSSSSSSSSAMLMGVGSGGGGAKGVGNNTPLADTDCGKAIAAIIASLYSASHEVFIGVLLEVGGRCSTISSSALLVGSKVGVATTSMTTTASGGNADYRLAIKVCELLIPHLHQDCERFLEGSKLLRHPEPVVTSPFHQQLQACSPRAATQQQQSSPSPNNNNNGRLLSSYGFGGGGPNAFERALAPTFDDVLSPNKINTVATTGRGKNIKNANNTNTNANDQSISAKALERIYGPQRHQQEGASSSSQFSPKRYDPTSRAYTDVGAAQLLQQQQQQQKKNLYAILPSRTADALSKLEALPAPLLALRQCSGGGGGVSADGSFDPFSIDEKIAAMQTAMDAQSMQPRLWSSRFKEFLSYFIAFATDPSADVRSASLQCLSKTFSTRYLLPLCVGCIDDALRCAVINISAGGGGGFGGGRDFAAEDDAFQYGMSLLKTICGEPSADGTAAASEGYSFGGGGGGGRRSASGATNYFDPTGSSAAFMNSNKDFFSSHSLTSQSQMATSQQSSSSSSSLYPPACILDAAMVVLEENADEAMHKKGPMTLFKVSSLICRNVMLSAASAGGALSLLGAGGVSESDFFAPTPTALSAVQSSASFGGGAGDHNALLGSTSASIAPTEGMASTSARHQQQQQQQASSIRVLLSRFVPIVVRALNSTHSEVRKQAVITLVDWYHALRTAGSGGGSGSAAAGPAFALGATPSNHSFATTTANQQGAAPSLMKGVGGSSSPSSSTIGPHILLPLLYELTTAQLKLVSIYYNRQYGHLAMMLAGGGGVGGTLDLVSEMERLGIRKQS